MGYGTCVYENPFAGTTDCIQYSGSGFTDASAKAACDKAMGGMAVGVLAKGTRCFASTNPMLAGHCYTTEGASAQAMPMLLLPQIPMMSTCAQVEQACTTWSRGRFVKGTACSGKSAFGAAAGAPTAASAPTAAPVKAPIDACKIAPGPMGSAHIHTNSIGYPSNCKDAPAKNSPYQLPPRWKADSYMVSLPYNTSEEGYSTEGTVYYDFTKNWKRADTFVTKGKVPFGFNGPADDWTGRKSQTMLHRGDKMYFIYHMEDGSKTCTYVDMLVGILRPDWYLDNRGSGTSVQYLGNQHIYHKGRPTLVRQWRKKDFADMYFTMSVQADKSKDGVHWPIQMNFPGEGFGPDGLQNYWNHKILGDDDDVFFPDKGLDCQKHQYGGDTEMGGPPDMDKKKIPSKLNVDEAGWFELEWTGSPQGPSLARAMFAAGKKNQTSQATTPPGAVDIGGKGQLHACEEQSGKILVTAKVQHKGWTAIGMRPASSSKCSMVPARINAHHMIDNKWTVHSGDTTNSMRGGDLKEFISKAKAAQDVEVTLQDTITSMIFLEPKSQDGKMHFSFAMGSSPVMSYHDATRGCVTIDNIPKCGSAIAKAPESAPEQAPASVSLQQQLADIAAKLDDAKPKCGQLNTVQKCNQWSLYCRWKASKCHNV